MRDQNDEGFTLVELMIVVAIIGILAAVAIPKFAQMLEKSREGATKGNLGALKSATSNYYADQQGVYPATLSTLTWSIVSGGTIITTFPAFIPNYVDQVTGVKVTGTNTANNPANSGPGVFTPTLVTVGTFASPAFVNVAAGQGWKYDNSSGNIWVNSTMVDSAGNSYTIYGFQ